MWEHKSLTSSTKVPWTMLLFRNSYLKKVMWSVILFSECICYLYAFSSASFLSLNTIKSHSCFSIVSCLSKHLGRRIEYFYERYTHENKLSLSLSLAEGVGYHQNGRFIEEYLLCHTTSTLLPKDSLGRTLENFMWMKPGKLDSFGPFLSIHKQRNDKLKEEVLHGAARSCMTS